MPASQPTPATVEIGQSVESGGPCDGLVVAAIARLRRPRRQLAGAGDRRTRLGHASEVADPGDVGRGGRRRGRGVALGVRLDHPADLDRIARLDQRRGSRAASSTSTIRPVAVPSSSVNPSGASSTTRPPTRTRCPRWAPSVPSSTTGAPCRPDADASPSGDPGRRRSRTGAARSGASRRRPRAARHGDVGRRARDDRRSAGPRHPGRVAGRCRRSSPGGPRPGSCGAIRAPGRPLIATRCGPDPQLGPPAVAELV